MQTRTYGTWESPLSAPALVAGARGFSELALDGDTLYWVESRPDEGGRQVLMRCLADGTTEELTGPEFNVRSRVHEYGGGAFSVANGIAYFTNFSDQTLFRLAPGKAPLALGNGGLRRYADCAVDSERQRLICVMEDHSREGEPSNTLAALDATGPSDPIPLFTESDFVASPALSSDGRYLAFIAWNHPNLPWDDTLLYIIELDANGEARKTRRINPGQHEAIMAPQWGPDGKLYVISDRDNWWNFYRLQGQELVQFTHAELEFGRPAWVFNNRLYGFLPDGDILALTNHRGREGLARVTRNTGAVQKLYLGLAETRALVVGSDKAFFVAGFPAATGGIVEFDWTAPRLTMIRASQSLALPITAISKGEAIAFPSGELADVDADPAGRGVEHRIAHVPRPEVELLPEALDLRDVGLAVLAQVAPVGVDHRRGVVVDPRVLFLVHRRDDHDAVLPGHVLEQFGGRAVRDGLGVGVVVGVLHLAEIRPVEEFLQAHHLRARRGGRLDVVHRRRDHRILVTGPALLDKRGPDDLRHRVLPSCRSA